ncbi:K+/H+ antiporter subunit F [Leptospira interrogans]
MLNFAITAAITMVFLAMALNLWRLARGPQVVDRILALDTLTINAIALILLFGMRLGTSMIFDAALLLAMMGFVGTAAFCKFILSGDVIE